MREIEPDLKVVGRQLKEIGLAEDPRVVRVHAVLIQFAAANEEHRFVGVGMDRDRAVDVLDQRFRDGGGAGLGSVDGKVVPEGTGPDPAWGRLCGAELLREKVYTFRGHIDPLVLLLTTYTVTLSPTAQ